MTCFRFVVSMIEPRELNCAIAIASAVETTWTANIVATSEIHLYVTHDQGFWSRANASAIKTLQKR